MTRGIGDSPTNQGLRLYPVLFGLAVFRLWVMQLPASLWLDETQTYYFVEGSWRTLFARIGESPQISPLYFVLLKPLHDLGFASEIWLRLPSTVAMGIAAYLLFRLASVFFDREAGWITCLVFISFPATVFAATNARPYGGAMLGIIAAALLLVRWFDRGLWRDGVGFVCCATLGIWFHYVFAVMLPVFAAYGVYRLRNECAVSRRELAGASVLMAAALSPLAYRMLSAWQQTASRSFAKEPALDDLWAAFTVPALCAGALAGLLIGRMLGRVAVRRIEIPAAALLLLVTWTGLPPLLLFITGRVTTASLFVGRYYMAMYAGAALLAGLAIRSLEPARARRVVTSLIVILAAASLTGAGSIWPPAREDWRGATAAVRKLGLPPDTPILLASNYAEAKDPGLLKNPKFRDYFMTPLIAYPVPGKAIGLPFTLDRDSEAYIEDIVSRELGSTGRVVVLARGESAVTSWIRGRLRGAAFVPRSLGEFRGVQAVLFERSQPAGSPR